MVSRAWQFFQTVLGVIFRHPVTGVTIVPILPDGRIVLVRRQDNGEWGLPGGIVSWGEEVAYAAKRELTEETGLNLVQIRRLVGVYSAPDRDPRLHSIAILIEAEVEGNLEVLDTLEISDVQAFDRENLPKGKLSHDHDRQLKDYFAGHTVLA
ncbi:MAG: NUDIX hydrolase [Geitlerinemataceae cyanobacterium]